MENAFGILVSRFRVMRTTIELPPETVREVVMTCVVLHNILRSQYQSGQDRNPAREAKRQRDYLKDYFNNERAVAWQDGRI